MSLYIIGLKKLECNVVVIVVLLLYVKSKQLWSCRYETVLMMGHKIRFNEEMWIIIPKLSLLPILIWSAALICCCNYQFLECERKLVYNFSGYC